MTQIIAEQHHYLNNTADKELESLFAGLPVLPQLRAFSVVGVCPHIAAPAVRRCMPGLRALHLMGNSCCYGGADLRLALEAAKPRLEVRLRPRSAYLRHTCSHT